MSAIFDMTTHLGEALAVLLRFMDDDFSLQQRLVIVQMLLKSLTGEEIDRELLTVLSVTYSVHPSNLLAAMRDRASTNNVAMQTLTIIYPNVVDIVFFASCRQQVQHACLIRVHLLMDLLISHSPKSRL